MTNWLSPKEVAHSLGMDVNHVRVLCATGRIPSKTWGTGYRVPSDAFDQWLGSLTDYDVEELVGEQAKWQELDEDAVAKIKSQVLRAHTARKPTPKPKPVLQKPKPAAVTKPKQKPKQSAPRKPRQSRIAPPPGDLALLTVPEAMEYLCLSEWTVYKLIRTEQLYSLKIGWARRIPRWALEQYIGLRTA